MSSARADLSGSLRFHWSSSIERMARSTFWIRASSGLIWSRGTLPAASQRSLMLRRARLAASRSFTGSSASASTNSSFFFSALAANSLSCSAFAASRASKEKVLGSPGTAARSFSSMSRGAGPAALRFLHQLAVATRGRSPIPSTS